jgi:uncharacterized membrane protein
MSSMVARRVPGLLALPVLALLGAASAPRAASLDGLGRPEEDTGPFEGPVQATRWVWDSDAEPLGTLPPEHADASSGAHAVSPDGGAIVGASDSRLGIQAFRWTESRDIEGLGLLDGMWTQAHAVSEDGLRVVGTAYDENGEPDTAFVWDAKRGMRSLHDELRMLGVRMRGWKLTEAVDISYDGTTIVGNGINEADEYRAWIAVVLKPAAEPTPAPEPAGAGAVAAAVLLWLRARRHESATAQGVGGGSPEAGR